MANKIELIAHAKAKISRLEINIRTLNEQIMKQTAEKNSYEDMIKWLESTKRKSNAKHKTNDK